MSKQIENLMADQLIATDAGAHAQPTKVEIFERLDGTRYGIKTVNGVSSICSADAESPDGYMRHLTATSPADRRRQIEHLRAVEIQQAKSAEVVAARRAELARGWDGYQFIGIEAGQKIAAAM